MAEQLALEQIFIMGASITYGVGGCNGGWADMLKLALCKKNFSGGEIDKLYEIYNFAKPGATADFVEKNYQSHIDEFYKEDAKSTVIISIGYNNAKAEGEADNYVSTPEEFRELMTNLLKGIKAKVDRVIFVGYTLCDETKTMPKISPFTGLDSYFSNERIQLFNNTVKELCADLSIETACVDIDKDDWIANHLFDDGLHPNDKGYKAIFNKVIQLIKI